MNEDVLAQVGLISMTDSDAKNTTSSSLSFDNTSDGGIKTVFKLDTYTTTIMSIFGC